MVGPLALRLWLTAGGYGDRACTTLSPEGCRLMLTTLTPGRSTFIYKRADGCEIPLDVYRPAADGPVPVVVWIHGGALIMGSRAVVPDHVLAACREHRAAVVSI